MEINVKAWVYDILNAAEEISLFMADIPDFKAYQKDLKAKRAIKRNLEIIGEAMSRILKSGAEISFTDARKIVETRNRIIHGYDSVSDEVIWGIIKRNLPKLKEEAKKFLHE